MAGETFKRLIRVEADANQAIIGLKSVETQLRKMGIATKGLTPITKDNIRVTQKQGQMMGVASRKFKLANGQIVSMQKPLGQATRQTGVFVKAMKRVLVVVPIWLAMRSAMMLVLRTLSGGIEYWRKFSSAMMKAKGVIHTTSMTIEQAYDRLAEGVKKLSVETGEAMADLTSAFYRFGTVGIGFEESMLGMEASTKAAMAMFGNVDAYAKTLALSYKLLGDTIDKTIPPNERLMSVSASLYGLWQKNAFEIDDFTQSLMNFLPTANTMNLTLDETIALLASVSTGAVQGARGGRLLRTSFAKLLENVDKVAVSLGLLVDLRVERPFDVFIRVLGEISALTRSGDLERASESVREIFGGVRGGQVVRALIAMEKVLKENIELLERGRYDELMAKFGERVEDVTSELDRQMKIMGNLRMQIGMTFIQAVFGGEKFEDTLKNINKFLETANVRGKVFYDVWAGIMSLGIVPIMNRLARSTDEYAKNLDKVTKALGKQSSLEEMNALIHELQTERLTKLQLKYGIYANNLDTILERLRTIRAEMETTPREVKYTAGEEGLRDPFTPQLPPPITMEIKTRLKLDELKEALKYKEMEARGADKIEIAEQKLLNYIKGRVKEYNKLKPAQGTIKKLISAEEILSKAMAGNYNEILEITKKRIIGEKEVLDIQKLTNAVREERLKSIQDVGRRLINHELEILKIRGASERQLFEINLALEKELYGEARGIRLLEDKLEKEKLITREKLNQVSVSSDAMKLYEIATKEGLKYAKTISEMLREGFTVGGMRKWQGKVGELIEQYFPTRYKETFAREYIGKHEELFPEPRPRRLIELMGKFPTELKIPELNIAPSFGGITINLPKGTLKETAELSGKKLVELLKMSPEFKALFSQNFWGETTKGH